MTKKKSPAFLLFMMLMSMTAGAMCLNKVSPIMTLIVKELELSGSAQAGLLISVFVISGIFLAIPIGVIMKKTGFYKMGIIALTAIIIGSGIGAMDISYPLLLASRVIEGIGLIILTNVGPAVVTAAYGSSGKLGAAMGLLMCFMTFGQIIMLNLAPRLAAYAGWKSIWWLTFVYAAVFLVLWIISLRHIDRELTSETPQNENIHPKLFPKQVFANWKMWCLGLTFMLYLIAQQGVIAFLPTYLTDVRGVDATLAGSMVSAAAFTGIFTAIIVGMISDKIGSRKKPIVVLLLAAAIVYYIFPHFPTKLFILIIILYGLAVMGIVGLCISAAS